jgi:hypothetical protein
MSRMKDFLIGPGQAGIGTAILLRIVLQHGSTSQPVVTAV